jgi:hypothetical protein
MNATGQVQKAGSSSTARRTVLLGWAAKGVVYISLAFIVLQMAFRSAPEQATTTGALEYIATTGPGRIALIVLGLGLIAFAVGRILEVTTLATSEIDTKDRVLAVVLAVVYTALAITAFGIVAAADSSGGGSGGGGGGGAEKKGSAFLLDLPAGRVIVALIGLAVIAVGVYSIYEGLKRRFLGTLRTGEMSSGVRASTGRIGTVAYVTKGAILMLIGFFFLRSALTYDPQEARGLDGALREIADESWGQAALVLVALGLLAYGAFALIEARYRRVGVSATGTT